MLNKFLFVLLTATTLLATSPLQAATGATGNVAFPILESSYQPNLTASLVVGNVTGTSSSSLAVSGLELALDCPLYQPSSGNIRQQISYTTHSLDGFSVTMIELNPHWMNEVSKGLFLGFGPGLGLATTSSNSYFEIGVGVSAAYELGAFQLGAEMRQMSAGDFNNSRSLIKAGYNF